MTEEQAAWWIGRRVMIRPGSFAKNRVGSVGEVEATQWSPHGWQVEVTFSDGGRLLVGSESQIRDETPTQESAAKQKGGQ